MTAAPLQHPGHLSVDGVEAELSLGSPVRRAPAARWLLQLQLGRVGELQRLQQAGLTLYKVGDGVHGQTTLQGERKDRWNQWWKVTKYFYSSTVLKYNFQVLVLEYFHVVLLNTSTSLHILEIWYFLLHYIYLTAVVTFQIKILH